MKFKIIPLFILCVLLLTSCSSSGGDVEAFPNLPAEASSPEAFVIPGWTLLDIAELDFNDDGFRDFIAVLDSTADDNEVLYYPRILFAAEGTDSGAYKLNFTDINLIRTQHEGGVYGDPYQPLTVMDNSFTINSYGGSSWRWSEARTFEFIDGAWYLIDEIFANSYGPITTEYSRNNYISGKGYRGYNNSDVDCIENIDPSDYDLYFTVGIGTPILLENASQRGLLAHDRLVGDITPLKITVVEGIDVPVNDLPEIIGEDYGHWSRCSMDENYILCTYTTADLNAEYLAVYDKQSGVLNVIAQTTLVEGHGFRDNFFAAHMYNDFIYYDEKVYDTVEWKKDGELAVEQAHIASRLIRISPYNGSRETVFEYVFYDGETIVEGYPQYCGLYMEYVDEGIIMYVYKGGVDSLYYFVEPDGGARLLGVTRGTSSNWLGDISFTGKIGNSLGIHMRLSVDEDGAVTGAYYYDKYGVDIALKGHFARGVFELNEEEGQMYGLTFGDGVVKGVWTNGDRTLPLILTKDGFDSPEPLAPNDKINSFAGQYNGAQANENYGSEITIIPLFDDLAYIDVSAYYNAALNVHTGGFSGLAVFDNNGLNYQAPEKIYSSGETIRFRITRNESGGIDLYTNYPQYNCGAGVIYDDSYIKKQVKK